MFNNDVEINRWLSIISDRIKTLNKFIEKLSEMIAKEQEREVLNYLNYLLLEERRAVSQLCIDASKIIISKDLAAYIKLSKQIDKKIIEVTSIASKVKNGQINEKMSNDQYFNYIMDVVYSDFDEQNNKNIIK